MKNLSRLNRYILTWLLVLIIPILNSCDVITGIFEAGVWIGVIVTLLVIGLIVFIIIKIIQKIF